MGCDIHTRMEIQKGSRWIDADYYERNENYGIDEYEKKFEVVAVCDDRNYSRFAILAGVRNYGKSEPISEPRGIPKDCNKHIKKQHKSYGSDAHSASYFTLKELIEFQGKNPVEKYSGYISPKSVKELDEKGVIPQEWCQSTTDSSWLYREWKCESTVLLPLIDALKERLMEKLYLYGEDKTIENADKIRFVFWFDN